MPSAVDLDEKLRELLSHSVALPLDAEVPIAHFQRSVNDSWNLLDYVDRNFDQVSLKPRVREQHVARLRMMLLIQLIEAFERFLKELAAACVDVLADFVADDRFDEFKLSGV